MSSDRIHPTLDPAALDALPGSEIVLKGLTDLKRGEETAEALVVAAGAERLRRAGLAVPEIAALPAAAEIKLMALLGTVQGGDVQGRYQTLMRRLHAFEAALGKAASGDDAAAED
jgi:hypothetical protein